jgi:hypothetical protein
LSEFLWSFLITTAIGISEIYRNYPPLPNIFYIDSFCHKVLTYTRFVYVCVFILIIPKSINCHLLQEKKRGIPTRCCAGQHKQSDLGRVQCSGVFNSSEEKVRRTIMDDQQQFCLRWNDFQTNMVASFKHLRNVVMTCVEFIDFFFFFSGVFIILSSAGAFFFRIYKFLVFVKAARRCILWSVIICRFFLNNDYGTNKYRRIL